MDENQNAWVITDVFSKTGVRITVKASGADLKAAIENMYDGMKHGIESHGWTTEQAGAPAKVNSPAPAAAPAAQKAVVDTNLNTLEVVKVEVTPKADNKVELKLYSTGHKYPDLYHNGTVDQVITALSLTGMEWLPEHLEKAATFDVQFFADWRNSEKLNGNGKPYKNIVGYRAHDATA